MKKSYEKPIFQKTQYISMDSIANDALGDEPIISPFNIPSNLDSGPWELTDGTAECGCRSTS